MALHIKLVKHNVKRNSSYGKYFAKAVSQGEVTLAELAEEACRNSSLTEGTVTHVVTELQDMLRERLAEGQTVVIDGIGRFSLRVESIGVDRPEDFSIGRHISRIVCGFLPSGHRDRQTGRIVYDFADRVKVVWQKGVK